MNDNQKTNRIKTDLINEWEYDNAIAEYTECNHGIRVCRVSDILAWIDSVPLEGRVQIAEIEFLKGQKQGESLMLEKIKNALSSERLWYAVDGGALDLLRESRLSWRATGDFALDVLLQRKPVDFVVYIKPEQIQDWRKYLSSRGAVPKDAYPDIVFIAENFDSFAEGYSNGIPLVKLERILADADPRHVESLQSEIQKLKQGSSEPA